MSAATPSHSHGVPARRVCWALLVLSLVTLVPVQRLIDKNTDVYGKISDVLYIPAGTNLRRFCLGNEGLVAAIYWTRVVQYFGRGHLEGAEGRYALLAPLLRITTDLDPQLLIAYRFGAIFLMTSRPAGAGEPEHAIELLRRGIVANPYYWRLWQDLGFVYYWELHDYKTAAKIFEVGSNQPGADFWLKALAGTVAAKGGDYNTSRFLWSQIYQHAEADSIRRTAADHLASLTASEQIRQLNLLLERHKEKTGHEAHSLSELAAAGLLRGVPVDPSGVPYIIGTDGYAALGQDSQINLRLLK